MSYWAENRSNTERSWCIAQNWGGLSWSGSERRSIFDMRWLYCTSILKGNQTNEPKDSIITVNDLKGRGNQISTEERTPVTTIQSLLPLSACPHLLPLFQVLLLRRTHPRPFQVVTSPNSNIHIAQMTRSTSIVIRREYSSHRSRSLESCAHVWVYDRGIRT